MELKRQEQSSEQVETNNGVVSNGTPEIDGEGSVTTNIVTQTPEQPPESGVISPRNNPSADPSSPIAQTTTTNIVAPTKQDPDPSTQENKHVQPPIASPIKNQQTTESIETTASVGVSPLKQQQQTQTKTNLEQQPPANTTAKQQPEKVSITVEQLAKWDTKIKTQSTKIKTLTAENTSLKNQLADAKKQSQDSRKELTDLKRQLAELKKKALQKNKNEYEGLRETISELQKILSETNTNYTKAVRDADRLRDELKIERELKAANMKQMETLMNASSDLFLMKQEVSRMEGELTVLRKSKESISQLEGQVKELQNRCAQLIETVSKQKEERNKIEKQKQIVMNEKAQLLVQIESLNQTISIKNEEILKQKTKSQELTAQIQLLETENKDLEHQIELTTKKYHHDMKELRDLLAKEIRLKDKMQQEWAEIKKESENRKLKDVEKYLGKKELELALRIEETEMETAVLKESMNRVSQQLHQLQQKVKEKDESIGVLVRELSSKWPNLEDSEGLQYVEKEIIEMGKKQKLNYGDIIEKVMIENLRLKHSIQTIGSEYNQELRKKIAE